MNPIKIKKRVKPETIIQEDIKKFLRYRGWFVKETNGNLYQQGFPDLFATHSTFGQRWIEVKNPDGWHFTAAQLEDFPKFIANGAPIWVLTAATEREYEKLFKGCNFLQAINGVL